MTLFCVDTSAWHHATHPEVAREWLRHPIASDASTFRRALEVQRRLAHSGGLHHRSVKIPDLLIAAAAEAAQATVLHYDEDYDRIAAITGQPVQWIAPRGSL